MVALVGYSYLVIIPKNYFQSRILFFIIVHSVWLYIILIMSSCNDHDCQRRAKASKWIALRDNSKSILWFSAQISTRFNRFFEQTPFFQIDFNESISLTQFPNSLMANMSNFVVIILKIFTVQSWKLSSITNGLRRAICSANAFSYTKTAMGCPVCSPLSNCHCGYQIIEQGSHFS